MSDKLSILKKQELAIVETEQRLELAKSMVDNTPRLAKIVSNKKIKNYLPSELIKEQENIVNYLMAIMGVSIKDDEQMKHVGMVGIFIAEEYKNYAYEEIKEAFKLAMKGSFDDFKMIYKLDCQVLTDVMSKYDIYKRKQLRIYNNQVNENLQKIKDKENMPTKKQNEESCLKGIKRCYQLYKKRHRIEVGSVYLYSWLFKIGLMPKDEINIKAIKKVASERFENRKKLAKNKKESIMYNIFENGKETVAYSNLCREISLEEFFKKFKTEKQMINHITKAL